MLEKYFSQKGITKKQNVCKILFIIECELKETRTHLQKHRLTKLRKQYTIEKK